VFASHLLAIAPLVSLTDREPARQIYFESSMLNALPCFGVARATALMPELAFLAFCAADQAGVPAQALIMLAVCALINFLIIPAGLLGNELSMRNSLLCPSHSFRPLLPVSCCF
jgi:hypothetical protein